MNGQKHVKIQVTTSRIIQQAFHRLTTVIHPNTQIIIKKKIKCVNKNKIKFPVFIHFIFFRHHLQSTNLLQLFIHTHISYECMTNERLYAQ